HTPAVLPGTVLIAVVVAWFFLSPERRGSRFRTIARSSAAVAMCVILYSVFESDKSASTRHRNEDAERIVQVEQLSQNIEASTRMQETLTTQVAAVSNQLVLTNAELDKLRAKSAEETQQAALRIKTLEQALQDALKNSGAT